MSGVGVHRTARLDRYWHNAHFKKHPDSNSKGVAKQRSNYTDSDNPSSYKAKRYCNACWEVDMQSLRDADAEVVRQSPGRVSIPDSVHENTLWNTQDLRRITRGDSKTMIHHLFLCPSVSDAVRQQATLHKSQQSPHHSYHIPQPELPYPSTGPLFSSAGAGPSRMGPPPSSRAPGAYPPSNYPTNLSLDYTFLSQTPPPSSPSWSNLGPNESASQTGSRSVSESRAATPSSRPASRVRSARSPAILGDVTLLQPWSPQRLHRFETLLGSIIASGGLPLRWVDNRYWKSLCEEFIPMAPQIGRNTMRRRILPSLRNELKAKVQESVRNRNGTLQEDAWTGLNHKYISAFMVGVKKKVFTVKTLEGTTEKRSGELLFEHLEQVYKEAEGEGWQICVIALVTDASGESRKARRLFAAKYPWVIVLDCYAHQINLIVGDFFKSNSELLEYSEMAVKLIGWLRRKNGVLASLSLAVIRAVLTRWTAHYQAYARLLQLRLQLKSLIASDRVKPAVVFIGDHDAQETAEEMAAIVENDNFWRGLVRITGILQPLAIATNAVQGSFVGLDTVLITFGYLLMRYQVMLDEPTLLVRDSIGINAIITSINKRWKKADQEFFVACLLVNPLYPMSIYNSRNPFFIISSLRAFLCKLYCRLFRVNAAPVEFQDDVLNYLRREGKFANLKDDVDTEIRNAKSNNRDFDPVNVLACSLPFGADDSEFLKFARRLLEVSTNSASCECLFSIFGQILSKYRTRMGTDLLEMLAEIKMCLRDELAQSGEERERLKKQFDYVQEARAPATPAAAAAATATTTPGASPNPPPASSLDASSDEPSSTNTDFRKWLEHQFRAVEEDDTDNAPVRGNTSPGFPMELTAIFDFSSEFWLDEYDKRATASLEDEMLIHEWLNLDADADVDDEIDPDIEYAAF